MIATPHKLANGQKFRNLYDLKVDRGAHRRVGGLVVLKDKAFAFAKFDAHSGAGNLVEMKIGDIIKRADAIAWGATPAEALAKIKPHLAGA